MNETPPRHFVVFARRFYYEIARGHSERRDTHTRTDGRRNVWRVRMKEIRQCARVYENRILEAWAYEERKAYTPTTLGRCRDGADASFSRSAARAVVFFTVVARTPIIDPRAVVVIVGECCVGESWACRPYFSGRFRTRRLSLTAGVSRRAAGPTPFTGPACVYFDGDEACALARHRLDAHDVGGTAVTPDTRPLVPLDGSPVCFFFSYPPPGARTRSIFTL